MSRVSSIRGTKDTHTPLVAAWGARARGENGLAHVRPRGPQDAHDMLRGHRREFIVELVKGLAMQEIVEEIRGRDRRALENRSPTSRSANSRCIPIAAVIMLIVRSSHRRLTLSQWLYCTTLTVMLYIGYPVSKTGCEGATPQTRDHSDLTSCRKPIVL